MVSWSTVVLEYVCPSIGALLSGIMFAAPITDVRRALLKGALGPLNPIPYSMMTGNCIGWCAFAYYTMDPFVLAANLPGLLISTWLNFGAIKLQYLDLYQGLKRQHQQQQQDQQEQILQQDEHMHTGVVMTESLTMVPQEVTVLRVMVLWSLVLLYVGWFHPTDLAADIVGIVVNVNLVFFYGAPLATILQVIRTKCSDSIHVPTMVLNWANTSFWIAYGLAQRDYYIVVPNACGLMLGLTQGLLCLLYPKSSFGDRQRREQEREQSGIARHQEEQEEEPLELKDTDEASRDMLIV